MLMRCSNHRRRATTVVECAVVYPVTFLILLGLIIGALGVFRYQEMAGLAREACRYASVHGAQYRRDAGLAIGSPGTSASNPIGTAAPYNVAPWTELLWYQTHPNEASGTYTSWADDIYDNSVRGKTFTLDPAQFQVFVAWTPVPNQPGLPDNYPGSRVTIHSQYPTIPEWIWNVGKSSISTAPMPITN